MRPALAVFLLVLATTAPAKERVGGFGVPASGVLGVDDAQLRAQYWIARLPHPDAVLMSSAQLAAQNARLLAEDPSMHALDRLPAKLARDFVLGKIGKLSKPPSRTLYFADGTAVPAKWLAARVQTLDLESIPESAPTRFALVVRRASLRTFPDATRVFGDTEDHDIDRFQESAVFTGTPVAILHTSDDGRWRFVLAPNYAAWVEADAIAEGPRKMVLGYATSISARMILGASAETVFTPEAPRVSAVRLEMGQRLPLASVPLDQPVNGQHPFTSWPLLLPVRELDGSLSFAPALLPKTADSAPAPLPYTRANLLRQAFKLLGERYGWGHDYAGRDCSGFVAEVYRSVGLELPRNTGDQSGSPVLVNRRKFDAKDDRATRERALAATLPGDLLFIPGHLMMVVGHVNGKLYVIHDIEGGSWLDGQGRLNRMHLNGVAVTPFAPLRFDEASDFTDQLRTILRLR